MKYFTPEVLGQVASRDDDVADAGFHAWDRAIVRYKRRWMRIKHAFPKSVRRFETEPICLHDAEVLSMARRKNEFVMVLHQEPPSRDIVILKFTLDGEMEIDTAGLPPDGPPDRVFWLYEEFDLDRDKRRRFEVMLSNGWIVKLHFRKFDFLVAEAVSPPPPAKAVPAARTA
jgi:hypothetical protein